MLPSLPFSWDRFHVFLLPLPFPSSIFSLLAQWVPPCPLYFLLQIFLSIFSAPPSLTHLIFVPACFLQLWGPQCPVFVTCGLFMPLLLPSLLSPSRSKHWNSRGDSLTSFMLDLVFYNPNPQLQWEAVFLPGPIHVKYKEESSGTVAVKCGDLQK